MTEFNRFAAESLAKSVHKAATAALEDGELTVTLGRTRYAHDRVTITLEITAADTNPGQLEFERHAQWLDLPREAYGKRIIVNGVAYDISGLAPRSPKFPILARQVSTGKVYKLTATAVRRAL